MAGEGVEIPISFDWSDAEAATRSFIGRMDDLLKNVDQPGGKRGPASDHYAYDRLEGATGAPSSGATAAKVELLGTALIKMAKEAGASEATLRKLNSELEVRLGQFRVSGTAAGQNPAVHQREYIKSLVDMAENGKRSALLAGEEERVAKEIVKLSRQRLAELRQQGGPAVAAITAERQRVKATSAADLNLPKGTKKYQEEARLRNLEIDLLTQIPQPSPTELSPAGRESVARQREQRRQAAELERQRRDRARKDAEEAAARTEIDEDREAAARLRIIDENTRNGYGHRRGADDPRRLLEKDRDQRSREAHDAQVRAIEIGRAAVAAQEQERRTVTGNEERLKATLNQRRQAKGLPSAASADFTDDPKVRQAVTGYLALSEEFLATLKREAVDRIAESLGVSKQGNKAKVISRIRQRGKALRELQDQTDPAAVAERYSGDELTAFATEFKTWKNGPKATKASQIVAATQGKLRELAAELTADPRTIDWLARQAAAAGVQGGGGGGQPPLPPVGGGPPEDPEERRRRAREEYAALRRAQREESGARKASEIDQAYDERRKAVQKDTLTEEQAAAQAAKEIAEDKAAHDRRMAAEAKLLRSLETRGSRRALTVAEETSAYEKLGFVPATTTSRAANAATAATAAAASQAAAQAAAQAVAAGLTAPALSGGVPAAVLRALGVGGGFGGGIIPPLPPPGGGGRGPGGPGSGPGGPGPTGGEADNFIESIRKRLAVEQDLATRMAEYLAEFGPLTRLTQQRRAIEAQILAADGRLHAAIAEEVRAKAVRAAKEAELLAADGVLHKATVDEARARAVRAAKESQLAANDSVLQDAKGSRAANEALAKARQSAAESDYINAVGPDAYYKELGEGAALTKARNQQIKLATERATIVDQDYIEAKANTVRVEEERRIRIKAAELGVGVSAAKASGLGLTPDDRGRVVIAQRIQAEQERTALLRQEIAQAAGLAKAEHDRKVAERELRAAMQQASQSLRSGTALDGGTRFQRLMASYGGRFGGQGSRDPEDQQRLGQFLGSRLLNSVGYSLSGGLIYGVVSQVREILREAEALQRELAILKGQFDATFGEDAQAQFEKFRRGILEISKDTGVSADAVTKVARQLAGVYEGNTEEALKQTQTGLRLGEVTGLPANEIGDSLLAISLAFQETTESGEKVNVTYEEIANSAIGLKNALSVPAGEIIKFTADIAPLAEELGFTLNEINGIAAVALQGSGRSGAAASEQLGRALATIQEKYQAVISTFQGTSVEDLILEGYGEGNIKKVFEGILTGYKDLSAGRQAALIKELGGARQAAVLASIFGRSEVALEAFGRESHENAGALDAEWREVSKTVSLAFRRMERAIEEFGLALFDAGLADALTGLANVGSILIDVVVEMFKVFGQFNQALGGIPGQLLMIALAAKSIVFAFKELQKLTVVSNILGGFGGGIGGVVRPGGTFSPYRVVAQAPGQGAIPGIASRYGALAGTGFAGSAAGGVVAGLAVPAAVVSVLELKRRYDAENKDMDVTEAALRRLARAGVNAPGRANRREAIQREIDTESAFRKVQFGAFGRKTPGDILKDELEEDAAPVKLAQLDAILARMKADPKAGQSGRYQVERRAVELARENLAKSPSDTTAVNFANEILDVTANIPELKSALVEGGKTGRLTQSERRRVKDTIGNLESDVKDQDKDPKLAADLFQVGQKTEAATRAVFKARIDQLQIIVDAGKKNNTRDAKVEQDLQNLKEAQSKLDQVVIARQNQLFEMQDLLGQDTLQGRVDQVQKNILNPDFSEDSRRQQTLEAFKLQKELIQRKLDEAAENNTDTAEERLRILQEGVKTPPALRKASIALQLGATQERRDEIDKIAKLTGQSVEQVTASLVDGIVTFGKGAKDVQIGLLKAGLAQAEATKRFLVNARIGGEDLNAIIKVIADTKAAIANAESEANALAPVVDPTSVTGSPEQIAAAKAAERQEKINRRKATFDLRKAEAGGDPLREAQIDLEAARYELSIAKEQSEKIAAQARVLEAQRAVDKAFQDIAAARRDLIIAQASNDPIRQAYLELAAADAAIREAEGEAARLRAQIERLNAENRIHDLMRQLFQSQITLAQAVASALGDTVEVARLGLQGAEGELARILAESPNDEAAINVARANVITAQRNLNKTALDKRTSDIQFQLQMGEITTGQAIEMYRALLAIPTNTEEDIRTIQLAIKQLTDQLGQDLQFNLPDLINLPTLYEARRLTQTPSGSSYQDNRVVSITLNANNAVDGEAAVQTIVDAINTSRHGTTARLY